MHRNALTIETDALTIMGVEWVQRQKAALPGAAVACVPNYYDRFISHGERLRYLSFCEWLETQPRRKAFVRRVPYDWQEIVKSHDWSDTPSAKRRKTVNLVFRDRYGQVRLRRNWRLRYNALAAGLDQDEEARLRLRLARKG